MKEMQPYRRRRTKLASPRREWERRNMRAACRVRVHRKIYQNMVKAFAEVRLLHRQIAAQSMAIRMPFARRVVPMPVRRHIVIVITTRLRRERGQRPVASSRIVHIMPATSKQCMDEQRSTQQATKNGTHHGFNRISNCEPPVYPSGTGVRHLPNSNFRQTNAAIYIYSTARPSQSSLLSVHGIFGPLRHAVN